VQGGGKGGREGGMEEGGTWIMARCKLRLYLPP
jgi:hypothetical protein